MHVKNILDKWSIADLEMTITDIEKEEELITNQRDQLDDVFARLEDELNKLSDAKQFINYMIETKKGFDENEN